MSPNQIEVIFMASKLGLKQSELIKANVAVCWLVQQVLLMHMSSRFIMIVQAIKILILSFKKNIFSSSNSTKT